MTYQGPQNRIASMNGHGVPQPVPQMVRFDPAYVAGRLVSSLQVGAPFALDQQTAIPLPDMELMRAKFVEAIGEEPTADNLTHLALLDLVVRVQTVGKAIFDAFRARHRPSGVTLGDPADSFPDAPTEDRSPQGLPVEDALPPARKPKLVDGDGGETNSG